MRRRVPVLRWLPLVALGLVAAPAGGEDAGPGWLSGTSYLRAVSLDLRGRPPTESEYAAIEDGGELPEELLEEWLSSQDFAEQVARQHREVVLNNLSEVDPDTNVWRLRTETSSSDIWYAQSRRGSEPYGWEGDACADFEAHLTEDGQPVPDDNGVIDGWVLVTPEWSDEPLKICAALLQDALVSPWGSDCMYWDGLGHDPGCGCGEDANWCWTRELLGDVRSAFAMDIDRRVESMILEDRPYLDLLTDDRAFVNGPIVHWLRNKNDILFQGADMGELPFEVERLPELDYAEQDTWVEVRLTGKPAGILTAPAYLLRFQSNRTRANRFSNDFLCSTFEAPAGGIDFEAAGTPTLDLTQRESCNYCHALLEPMAAAWGRWVSDGARYLPSDAYPPFDDYCAYCGEGWEECPVACEPYVQEAVVAEEQPWVGWLRAYEFLDERYHHHVEEGPRVLVEQGLADGRLPRCVASKAAERLLGRDLAEADGPWLDELTTVLEDEDWSYRSLVRAILISETYRRLP